MPWQTLREDPARAARIPAHEFPGGALETDHAHAVALKKFCDAILLKSRGFAVFSIEWARQYTQPQESS
jgi:hypothetical protein